MGFVDDLKQKAKDTAEKTNKLTREMRIKSMMNDYKGAIEKIYAEIGKKVYEKYIREENIDIRAELAEECSKIDAHAKEIEDLRMEMLALKDLRICKNCAAEISISAKFCPKCGTVQEEIKPAEENKTENTAQPSENTNVSETPAMPEASVVDNTAVEETQTVEATPVVTVTPVEVNDNPSENVENSAETNNNM